MIRKPRATRWLNSPPSGGPRIMSRLSSFECCSDPPAQVSARSRVAEPAVEIEASTQDSVSIVKVIGYLDTRASSEFEKKMLELIKGGARLFAIDFTKLDMITSAGIRVLMMVVKRLGGTERVALWGLNDQVKVVFSIAGL